MASAACVSEIPEPLSGKFNESFAYVTIKDRLPVILTKVIDTVYRERYAIASSYGLESTEEVKNVIGCLSELRNEMLTNKLILPLKSNGFDVNLWNAYLKHQRDLYGFDPAWYESPWLYVECYLYRRIKEAFELSGILSDFDSFKQQKDAAFTSSISAAILLATALQKSIAKLESSEATDVIFNHFVQFVEISLWGNKCDLSISGGSENYQSDDPLSKLDAFRSNILVNEIEILWAILCLANKKYPGGVKLDLVLDNAGFELFSDLCLLEFLHSAKLINEVRLYVKVMPWYVSDTLSSDIEWTLNMLMSSDDETLVQFGKQWSERFNSKVWSIEHEIFWTLPHDYSEMKQTDPALFSKLSESHLIIFKGDLNYRKLTSDRMWDPTTSFQTALRGFLPTSLCSLRTIKNDVITSLAPGVKEEMDKKSTNWMFTGEYAVIQCVPIDNLKQ